jgi:hypothetical protein
MASESTFSSIWTKIGGRKLIAYFLGLAALVGLAFHGSLTETAMWGIVGLSGTYAGGNVGSSISSALKARATAIPGAPAPVAAPPKDDTEE